MSAARPKRILIVTGLAGAGRTTALKTFEDMGWETVDNLPLSLLGRLIETPPAIEAPERERPLAIGIDSQTRGFDPDAIVGLLTRAHPPHGPQIESLFLDCGTAELIRRYSATRHRHPLSDRPVEDGIARDRELLDPLRRVADHVIDTSETNTNALQQMLRDRFAERGAAAPTLTVLSFGFSSGVPRNADLVFDMRFLRNPHWDAELRPHTGLEDKVGAYIAADEAYEPALSRIEELILMLLPRYAAEGKSYVTVAFGCTGGRHRSVHVAERVARRLRAASFSPTVAHRDLG